MAQLTIAGGRSYDVASPAEVKQIVADQLREREHARGIKPLRRDTALITPAGTRFTAADAITPESGYVWAVRILSVQLASAGTGEAFITSDTNTAVTTSAQRRLLAAFGTSSQYQVATFNSGACILNGDEGLFLSFSQNITAYMVAGWEVPAQMAYKLL